MNTAAPRRAAMAALCAVLLVPVPVGAAVDEDQLGAWYMYFFNGRFGDGPWGV